MSASGVCAENHKDCPEARPARNGWGLTQQGLQLKVFVICVQGMRNKGMVLWCQTLSSGKKNKIKKLSKEKGLENSVNEGQIRILL
jgi:hypothetical protein